MLNRTMDAATFNRIANDPAVRPGLGGGGSPVDMSAQLADPANVALLAEHGGFVFLRTGPARYEQHMMFLPEGRGAPLAQATAEAYRWLFTRTDAQELITFVLGEPADAEARAVRQTVGRAGYRKTFDGLFPVDGRHAPATFHALALEDWAQRDEACLKSGEAFHDDLEAFKASCGSTAPAHDDYPAHNRAIGAAILMLKAGQVVKAAAAYNRWASVARFAPIRILSERPAVIDFVDALATVNDGELEFLLCPGWPQPL
jgi:hypothetical protein